MGPARDAANGCNKKARALLVSVELEKDNRLQRTGGSVLLGTQLLDKLREKGDPRLFSGIGLGSGEGCGGQGREKGKVSEAEKARMESKCLHKLSVNSWPRGPEG